jgi:cell shape-determining protein MreC
MKRRRWILGILIVVLVAAILFMPSYGWKLRSWLSPPPSGDAGDASAPNLAAQNDALKAQLAIYQAAASQLPQASPQNEIRAMVYSRYPLNFKNEILVNAGLTDGVATGTAVVFQGMLIGRVLQAFPHEALIQTVFDSGFEIPVRVGSSGYDGLFEGGPYPKVGSIAKTASLNDGDVIYAAAPGLPYGVPIGSVSATSTSGDSLFTEAAISFPYDMNNIQTVSIDQSP